MKRDFLKPIVKRCAWALLAGVMVINSVILGDERDESSESRSIGGAAAVTGQAEGVDYSAILYDESNGLPTSDANTVYATSDGFIWIGGYSGLIRYDGTNFSRHSSSGGVANVNALYEDHLGRIWVGTNDNGVVMLEKGHSMHFTYADGLTSSTIRTISEDGLGNVYMGTTQGICYIDSEMKMHRLHDIRISNAYIIRLITDTNGNVYGCARTGACFRIRDGKVNAYFSGSDLGIGDITDIYTKPDSSDKVYLGTSHGLFCEGSFERRFADLRKWRVRDADNPENRIDTSINWITYAADRFWVLSDDKVTYLDPKGKFHFLEDLPVNSSLRNMTEDYEGNLWVSSARQGVMKIVANKFSDVSEQAGLDPSVVNTTCLRDGALYIGTDSGLQIIGKDQKPVTNKLTEYIGDSRIRCIMKDADDNLWISTYTNDEGLICYSKNNEIRAYTTEDGLPSNQTRGTKEAKDGSILVATNLGLAVLQDGKVKKVYDKNTGLRNSVILTVEEGANGELYLGTDGDGIYVIEHDVIKTIRRENGLTSDVIMRIKRDDENGVYWVISSNSLSYLKDGEVHTVDQFPYSNNYDIYFDNNGNAWVLASNGIYVANVKAILSGDEFEYFFYDIACGLPSSPTGNSYSELTKDGVLYVATRTGACRVNINQYFEKTHDIRLIVPYIEADGNYYFQEDDHAFHIPASSRVVTIYGFALTYSMVNPRISYCLEGFEDSETMVDKKDMTEVRYTNLKGGEYKFCMSVVNASTKNVQQVASVKIIKEKAFYEWVWFNLLCLCILLILAWALVRLYIGHRTKIYKQREQEGKTFVREMTEAFAKTIDMKDRYTNGHSKRVAEYTAMLTEELGYDNETVEKYYNIALLHDIGKIGVPSEVLNKPDTLTPEEYDIVKSHSILGYNVLKDISIMPELAIGAGAHHERPDGKGYPRGLKEDQIPRVAQIIAVADTFDAMYSERPYRKRMKFEKIVEVMIEVSGTQLASDVVDAFLRLVEKGEFRAPDDEGEGVTEVIDNIEKS